MKGKLLSGKLNDLQYFSDVIYDNCSEMAVMDWT